MTSAILWLADQRPSTTRVIIVRLKVEVTVLLSTFYIYLIHWYKVHCHLGEGSNTNCQGNKQDQGPNNKSNLFFNCSSKYMFRFQKIYNKQLLLIKWNKFMLHEDAHWISIHNNLNYLKKVYLFHNINYISFINIFLFVIQRYNVKDYKIL